MPIIVDLHVPEFLYCEIPIKDGSIHDHRIWIFCPKRMTLLEAVHNDVLDIKHYDQTIRKEYLFLNKSSKVETITLAFIQNNVAFATNGAVSNEQHLDQAWDWLKAYLAWADAIRPA